MSTAGPNPSRGEVWRVNLEPVMGHEQGMTRPAVVVSVDPHNHGPGGMVVIVPMTTTIRPLPWRIRVAPPEGGCTEASNILCDQVRTISKARLIGSSSMGRISPEAMEQIEDRLRILMGL